VRVERNYWPRVGFGIGLGAVLYVFGFTAFLFVLPLLLLTDQLVSLEEKLLPFGLLAIVVFLVELIPQLSTLGQPLGKGLLAMGLFLPVALIGSSVIWTILKKIDVLSRFLICASFIGLVIVIFGVWFMRHDASVQALDKQYIDLLNSMFTTVGSDGNQKLVMGVEPVQLYYLLKHVIASLLLPVVAAFFGFSAFLQLASRFRDSMEFTRKISDFHIPSDYVWFFLCAWLAFVAVAKFGNNQILSIVVLNIALFFALVYAIQGMSIVTYRMVHKGKQVSAVKLFVITGLLAILLPGLNIVIVFVFPLLGVMETWFTLRK
jgi:hypothetical protein